ncbi:hypothetical protein H6758_02195 [Candidatus Nomurabacteria bacterium]|nr:hypothetical protein [Candidatus Nomurabacteria bacterium]
MVMVFGISVPVSAQTFPKKANYFLNWELTQLQAKELAKWDLVILDQEIGAKWPQHIQYMRQLNPNIKIVAYMAPFEVPVKHYASRSRLRRYFGAGLQQNWYLRDIHGRRMSFWQGTDLMNITDDQYRKYVLDFVQNQFYATGIWDGVFFDNAWADTHWYIKDGADLDLDGQPDLRRDIDEAWRMALYDLFEQTRLKTDKDFIILANGLTDAYYGPLDGLMVESLETHDWNQAMSAYTRNLNGKKVGIINNNTQNSGRQDDYRAMRFGLTSALLADGYYSFDHGDQWHGQTWWYDEYDVLLGISNGPAGNFVGEPEYSQAVWVREFQNGVVVVNATDEKQTVELSQDFEKIQGGQDPTVNDGSIVSQIVIDPKDGLVMRKLVSDAAIEDIVYDNGSFARFFEDSGEKSRNGFFVFDERFEGGDKIGEIDVNGDSQRDFVHVTGNALEVIRHDGQKFFKKFPYGFEYEDGFEVLVADILGDDGKKEFVIVPGAGSEKPVVVYGYSGSVLKSDWYPFGSQYAKSYLATSYQGGLLFADESKGSLGLYYQNGIDFKELKLLQTKGIVDIHQMKDGNLVLARYESGYVYIDVYGNDLQKLSSTQALKTNTIADIDIKSLDIDFDGEEEVVLFGGGVSF